MHRLERAYFGLQQGPGCSSWSCFPQEPPSGLCEGSGRWCQSSHNRPWDLPKSKPGETVAAQDCVWVGVFERDNYWVRQENIYLLL